MNGSEIDGSRGLDRAMIERMFETVEKNVSRVW